MSITKCPECGGDKIIAVDGNKSVCQYCGATFENIQSAPAPQTANTTRCPICGGEILFGVQKCRHCGEWLNRPAPGPMRPMPMPPQPMYNPNVRPQHSSPKSKGVAAVLAFFVGWLGIHEFYLGKTGAGVAFLLCTLLLGWMIWPLFIIGVINLIQAISYLSMSDEAFAEKYS